jgi:hypothetical protein
VIRLALSICAFVAYVRGHDALAIVDAVLAVAWSMPARGWLAESWRDALRRQQESTLFSGQRDD